MFDIATFVDCCDSRW